MVALQRNKVTSSPNRYQNFSAVAAEKYKKAMSSEKGRDQLVEDYLPLVKTTYTRNKNDYDTYS